ncbi:hypothetical protein I302_103855 [Kwoniella bestiolae CBS 10118]|uniref:Uncharacterized protein n=1 Tax=Kwoniella bestiolae CBS 10118 TaxID=1296100 RepID=A0A1B9G9M5_9TREE|nr:hypothetical protein I302_02558 [Kwoniella bestiolae CBS 10118]OCF27713.1 hypothetical protein I302_02558 [Kwoniella bestiolae CBS 10118]
MSAQIDYTQEDKGLVVRRRLVAQESFKDFLTWAKEQNGNLSSLTEALVKKWIDEYQRSHRRNRYKLFWKEVGNKVADDLGNWQVQAGDEYEMNGYNRGDTSLTADQQLKYERRRQMIHLFLLRQLRSKTKSLSTPFNLSLTVEGLNILWPADEIPGRLPFTEEEVIEVMSLVPDMPLVELLSTTSKSYSPLVENVNWKPKESHQSRICLARAQRCEDLAVMANVTIPRHLILYIIPHISNTHPHYAWCGKAKTTPVNPFFNSEQSGPKKPRLRQIETLIKEYLEDGWGFTLAQISYSLRAGTGYNVGLKNVLDYLIGRKYPDIMYPTDFVKDILKRSNWRYAALTKNQEDLLKAQAESDMAHLVARRESRDEEEQHQFRLSVARACLKTWCKIEGVSERTFFEYRLLMIFVSDRDTSFRSVIHPHLYPFLYSFGINAGDISADEMYTPVPYPTREWIWRWIHFIVDPNLDSSLASNSARGMDLMTRSSLDAALKQAIAKLIKEDVDLFQSQGLAVPEDILSLGQIIEGSKGQQVEGRLYWYFINILQDLPEVLPLGCEFRVSLVNYCNSRGHDPLQSIINVRRWEMELVLDYWMTEGSFYAADWVLAAICKRKRTTIQRLIFSQSHRYPLDMRMRRDWTLPYGLRITKNMYISLSLSPPYTPVNNDPAYFNLTAQIRQCNLLRSK